MLNWLQDYVAAQKRALDSVPLEAVDAPLPQRYWRYLAIWAALGVVAFAALVVVFYLMVRKPL